MSALLQKNNRKLKETITVKKAMKSTMVFAVLATIVFTILYRITENGVLLSLAITAGTISYHFVMRYTVAGVFSHTMHNRANLSRKWYQQKKWEKKLYRKLHVKQWKNKMPTYEPSYFDLRLHTPEEIASVIQPQFSETDTDTITTIIRRYQEQDTWKTDLVFSEDSFELLLDILESAGQLEKRPDYKDVVTTEYAEKALQ